VISLSLPTNVLFPLAYSASICDQIVGGLRTTRIFSSNKAFEFSAVPPSQTSEGSNVRVVLKDIGDIKMTSSSEMVITFTKVLSEKRLISHFTQSESLFVKPNQTDWVMT